MIFIGAILWRVATVRYIGDPYRRRAVPVPGKPLNPALEEFLRFILSREGQQIVLDHAMYVPLRGFQVDSSRALLTR